MQRAAAARVAQAKALFTQRRERLEAKFFTHASESGRPRGLAWTNCDFQDETLFARDRKSGDLRALVGVTISFEAIEGEGMEDNPNVGNLRAATSVFYYDGQEWSTTGRAIFNLEPSDALDHYAHELERLEEGK